MKNVSSTGKIQICTGREENNSDITVVEQQGVLVPLLKILLERDTMVRSAGPKLGKNIFFAVILNICLF